MKGLLQDIESNTNENDYFQRVLFTAKRRNIEFIARNNAPSCFSTHRRIVKRYLFVFIAVLSVLALSACDRQTEVVTPANPNTVVVTPAAGLAGAQGYKERLRKKEKLALPEPKVSKANRGIKAIRVIQVATR